MMVMANINVAMVILKRILHHNNTFSRIKVFIYTVDIKKNGKG